MSGRTHSDASKTKISDAMTGENNPMFGKNHTEESKTIMSDAQKKSENSGRFKTGHKHYDETKIIMSEAKKGENNPNYGEPKPEGAGRPSQQIEVIDNKNNQTTSYDSIHEAARALNIKQSIISMYFANNQQKPYKGRYTFKKI